MRYRNSLKKLWPAHRLGSHTFLRIQTVCTLVFMLLAILIATTAVAADRPNIIFLMDDQHRNDALGKLDPKVITPTLDRLAEGGILFDQAVCQAPMCIPSRYSMMLGLYPNQIGILNNQPGLKDEEMPCDTLAEVLRKAGYQTAGFGKTHWAVHKKGGCSTRGFEVRYDSTDTEEKGSIHMKDDVPEAFRRYDKETKPCGPGGEDNLGYAGFTSKLREEEHRDGWAMNRCLEFLDKGRDPDRPLFLYFSCLAPHAPHNVPPGYEELYNPEDMPVPEQPPEDLVEPCHATDTNRESMYRPYWSKASREEWQQMMLRYRANCTWIDSLFGRILKKLEAEGVLDNCLIVYVSDHGEMLGERYYRFNKYCLFEHSVRVPLILAGTAVPKDKRNTVDHRLAELVDIMPTILRVAGVDGADKKPGEDLLEPSSRKANFCELNKHRKKISFMWRTPEYKLILSFPKKYSKKESVPKSDIITGEFYDLRKDPKEWHNLYDKEEIRAKRDRMTDELIEHLNRVALKRAKPKSQ